MTEPTFGLKVLSFDTPTLPKCHEFFETKRSLGITTIELIEGVPPFYDHLVSRVRAKLVFVAIGDFGSLALPFARSRCEPFI